MRVKLEGKNAIENYVHDLTHELKSPLAAIRGAAEILREEPPPEVAARGLLIISSRKTPDATAGGGAAAPAGATGKPAGDKAAAGVDRCAIPTADGGRNIALAAKAITSALAGEWDAGQSAMASCWPRRWVICSTTRD